MFDKEIEAIAKCTESIKELDDDAKFRVLKYLIERFGIGTNSIKPNQTFYTPQILVNSPLDNQDQVSKENRNDNKDDFPTLKQLLIKNLPKNEPEWILCFAFYCSDFGEDTFKREDIVDKYKESNKYSDTNRKNLNQNLNACIKKDWLKDYNKDEFILKEEGINYAKEILKGNSISREIKRPKKNKANLPDTNE